MTWRAFIIGLVFAAAIGLVEPWVSWAEGWGGFSGNAFPAGAVFVLVLLTVGVNVLIKLVRRAWAFRQAELMLVWCMLIVAATFPGDGIARFWFSFTAAPPYIARRADVAWEDGGALTHAPEALVLSNSPRSVAAARYFQGSPVGVPWSHWARPLLHWAVFFVLLYVAIFCLMAILRRQWVEKERLMFPLARVPLDFTEGAGERLLPEAFSQRGFQLGLVFAFGFRLLRALPIFFGAERAVPLLIPFKDVFQGTPLEQMAFQNISFWVPAVGFAFLVPADVSLSVWLFYLVARTELKAAHWLGLGSTAGAYGPMLKWQQAGAYFAFAVGMLFMARRHLWAVLLTAVGLHSLPDRREPVRYRTAVFGLVLSAGGCLVWYMYHGMRGGAALAFFALVIMWHLIYARVVAQAGLYVARTTWRLPEVLHGLSGGRIFGPPGAVIANLQDPLLVTGGTAYLGPMAMNVFRISEVFEERKRHLLVPVVMIAFLVTMACGTWTSLRTAYRMGGANYSDRWAQTMEPKWRMDTAQRIIKDPNQSAQAYPGPLAIGILGMGFLLFMRARFYWWPVHAIGLLTCDSWHAHRLWLPFLVGWLCKVGIMKLGGGGRLRQARHFFVGLILVEFTVGAVSTIVRTLTGGAVPGF